MGIFLQKMKNLYCIKYHGQMLIEVQIFDRTRKNGMKIFFHKKQVALSHHIHKYSQLFLILSISKILSQAKRRERSS